VEDGARRPVLGGMKLPATRSLLLYAGLALVPVVIFVVMMMLAGGELRIQSGASVSR